MAGLSEDSTDIFLSQISMLTDWDVLMLQECFRKLDGVNVGAHELFTLPELLGRIAMPGSHRQSEMVRTIEDCWGCGKMDCGRVGWTVDHHFSTLASQRKKTRRIRGSFVGNSRIREWETQTTSDLGWRLQCEPVRHDRLFPCGGVDSKTKNAGGNERLLSARALHTMVTELDLKVTNTWMHRTRAFHAFSSWSNPEDSLTQ